ncbi:MAG: BamA/TamA family outer membrane protein [Candidatus Eisenbacteria bacterium]
MRRHVLAFVLVVAAVVPAGAAPLPGWPAGARVERVRVLGLAPGAEANARRALALPGGGAPDSAAVVAATGRLLAALEGDGFLDATIDSVVAGPLRGAAADARAELVVHATPGPRATLARVTWDGLVHVDPAEAARLSGLTPGAPFRPGQLAAGLARVLDAYEARAHPAARLFVVDLSRSGAGAGVTLALRAIEGDSIIVREVAFPGAVATRRSVLEKSVQGAVGVPYDRGRVRDARQRLADLGVFARVDEPLLEALDGGRARLSFPLTEGAANAFDGALGFQGAGAAGGGVGQGRRITGLFDLTLGNLGGSARQAAVRFEGRGGGVNEFRLRYAEPLLFGLALRGELALDQLVEDTLYTRTRGALRMTFSAWSGARAWLAVASERTVLQAGPVERATSSATEAGIEADRRDDPLNPRRGYRASFATGTAFKRERLRPADTRRATQVTAWLRAQGHRPLCSSTGLRLDVDGALRLSNEPVVPFYDLDPVGGALSLRGYREGQFRASRWAVARSEFAVFPAAGGRAYAFADQGVLYRPFLDLAGLPVSRTDYHLGGGLGAEVPSGLGLVSLSLGWGRGDGPLDGKLHVRLINRF